jgi:hypothetical protein
VRTNLKLFKCTVLYLVVVIFFCVFLLFRCLVSTQHNVIKYIYLEFNDHGSVRRHNILVYIQQDATLHSLLYLETALHVSGDTITHHQERKQLYLQRLVFVTLLLLSAAIVEELEPV